METYCNEDIKVANNRVAKPNESIDEVEQGEQERHIFNTSGPDYQPLYVKA